MTNVAENREVLVSMFGKNATRTEMVDVFLDNMEKMDEEAMAASLFARLTNKVTNLALRLPGVMFSQLAFSAILMALIQRLFSRFALLTQQKFASRIHDVLVSNEAAFKELFHDWIVTGNVEYIKTRTNRIFAEAMVDIMLIELGN